MPHKSSQAPMVSGSGRYVESGAVAGAHRPQPSDLTSKKMSPDGFSTCKQYSAPLSKPLVNGQDPTSQGSALAGESVDAACHGRMPAGFSSNVWVMAYPLQDQCYRS